MHRPNISIGRIVSIIFHSALLSANFIVALLLLMASYADIVPPGKVPYLSYVGMAFPIFALVNFLFLIYWVLLSKWQFTLLPLFAMLLSWGAMRCYFPINLFADEPVEGSVKLLSYNVKQFDMGKRDANKKNATLEYIAEQNADIVCLQEFGYSKDSKMLRLAEIRKRLKSLPYYHVYKITDNHWHTYGLACFSKYPITDVKAIDFHSHYNGAVAYTVNVNGKKVRLVNCHLESNKFTSEDRMIFKQMVEGFSTDRLNEAKGALVGKMESAFVTRAKQAKHIVKELKSHDMESIVCGDFNDTPLSYTYRTIRGDMNDAFVSTATGLGITYYENHFYFRIDHILHSGGIDAYDCRVDRVKYSDHYPIHTYLNIK
ncbi:MAG: endonuclease/exonuclease/phosphatase family protein [Bacteroidales bacterium]